jgi:SGF29 tudor-like domain
MLGFSSRACLVFYLPESQVIMLGALKNPSKGDSVYAVYPDTTSFYPATITQTARKVSGGGGFVMVQFVDDSDEHGITHEKAILLQYLMRPPYTADHS